MKTIVYNKEGAETGSIDLNDAVFGVPPNESLVHQVYVALAANMRQPWSHSKDRSDVSGGGRKPWRQKGTGRARHGSIRSPIWKGGGVVFGPLKNRNYKQKINKKMNRQAVRICLSDKAANKRLIILEELICTGKTKEMAELRKKLPGAGRTTILLVPKNNIEVTRAVRNIQRFDIKRANDVNVMDLLRHQYVILTKEGIEVLEKRLS